MAIFQCDLLKKKKSKSAFIFASFQILIIHPFYILFIETLFLR